MAINIAQSVAYTSTGTTSLARTLNGVTVGNLLVTTFIVSNNGVWTGITVTDNQSNTYTTLQGFGENGQPMGIAYAENVTGGNTTVTISGGVGFIQANFIEVSSGTAGALLHFDQNLSWASGSGVSLASNSATTTSANEIIIGTGQSASGTISAGSGFTAIGSSLNNQLAEYQVVSSASTYNATMSNSTSVAWGMMGATWLVLPIPVFNTKVGRFNGSNVFVGNLLAPIWTNVNTSPVTVSTNTVSDQNLMSAVVPANTLNSVGRTLRVVCKGVYSTPISSTATLEFKIKLGTLTLIDITTTANVGTITNNGFILKADIATVATGASATFESSGLLAIDLGATTATAASMFTDINTAVSTALDTTANQTLQVTVAFSSGSASNSCTQRQMILNTIN